MRDTDKLKEKVELSLDNRQVVSLIVGSLVMLGIVFVLGVLFGKQMGPAPAAVVPGREELSALDREPDAGPVRLTFQEDLTRPASPGSSDLHAAAARTAPAARADARLESPPTNGGRAAPRAPSDPAPGSSTSSHRPPAGPGALAAESAPAPVPAPEPQPAPTAPAPAPTLDKKLADAFTAARGAAPQPSPAVVAPSEGYTVQVAASQDKAEADQAMAKLGHSSLRPYLTEADIPGKGHWYRVRVGGFPTRAAADGYAKDLRRETGVAAFATSVH